jgi:hypothetical protein
VRCIGSCKATFTVSIQKYPLRNSLILDSGTILHIFNEILRLINFRAAPPGDFVWAGDSKVAVLGYGEADIEMNYRKTNILHLCEVAFCPDLVCNLVLL